MLLTITGFSFYGAIALPKLGPSVVCRNHIYPNAKLVAKREPISLSFPEFIHPTLEM
jgi:hypothetical protein